MSTQTTATVKARLSALLDEVEAGGEVTITRRGKVVARLIPAGPAPTALHWDALETWLQNEPAREGLTVADMRAGDLL